MTLEEIASAGRYLLEDLEDLEVTAETKKELIFFKNELKKFNSAAFNLKEELSALYDNEVIKKINYYFKPKK